ncbi:hypothetical protein MPTK1_3g08610 [Marchantia polymorpha subsp. ruderalis]|uniref:RRM domain-containing protein n=2 Tax=Marchantia polymorpha TaxID=3197 RepID=A0AAF6AYR1_MARPO|nr:hypothetical protein MARPO_0105s0056 [Marchantia polymorpha]PTQ31950.1 hypothetical protein MARPO_0105s0056 [Marchantia polymorpha]BBN04894.1 hypothetical protein Mp_3g08610 [Marchantia polymorpha subsp. ruderalis]BBN04895.1 hypothetical protein Mp_3g08610 [Marchantia polymorpha subsp. ruderalis]|eukprot:PTQ31949.1 hypothetical protein MARPO_0105s0056 [Marchantia polymorpha]
MPEHTVRVGGVSLRASEHDIRDFFSFSGEITHIELQREGDWSQVAYVTFKNADALETALLLSGATIVDQSVSIIPMEGYVLPRSPHSDDELHGEPLSAPAQENKAQAVITEMLAKGYLVGKDAMAKAKQFDEKHGLTATAAATVVSVDKKLGLTEKITAGTSVVNQQLKAVDEKYQVSGKTKSAFAVAEEKVNTAGSAIMKNRYVLTGASWMANTFNKVKMAAGEVGQKVREKAVVGETTHREDHDEHPYGGDGYSRVHTEPAAVSLSSAADNAPQRYPSSRGFEAPLHAYSGSAGGEPTKPPPAQGLVL